jgi:hypothetical protein
MGTMLPHHPRLVTCGVQNSNEMGEDLLEDPYLDLVKDVNNK